MSMKHFKDENGAVYAFEANGSQDAFIPANLVPITDAEANELRSPSLADYKLAAQLAIDGHFAALYNEAALSPAIAHEYDAAYLRAKEWIDAGAIGPAPVRVTVLAQGMSTPAQSVTDVQAAQFVIAKWQEAESVLDRRGAERLRAKAMIRAAQTAAGVDQAQAAGVAAMEAITYTV